MIMQIHTHVAVTLILPLILPTTQITILLHPAMKQITWLLISQSEL